MSAPLIQVMLEDGTLREIAVPAHARSRSLASILADHGFPLNTRCGQRNLCKGCEVMLFSGSINGTETNTMSGPQRIRACQTYASGTFRISIPPRSRMEHRAHVSETFRIDIPFGNQPLVAPIPYVKDLGVAIDLGTTTVVVLLVDLATGEILSRAGAFNQQIRFGDNVLTRIDAVRAPGALQAMQAAAAQETLVPLLTAACEKAHVLPSRLACATIAGNTTMLHLLASVDPTPLGIAPFTPVFLEPRTTSAGALGITLGGLSPEMPVQLLPGIAAYVGADIAAGVYATGMLYDETPALLVDVGTNGEIVLQHNGRLLACATAAGPAFEGCGLRSGTRAQEGAVSKLRLRKEPFDLQVETLGNLPVTKATGICGSAYIDFLSEARREGLLSESGRFYEGAWATLPAACRTQGENAFRLSGEIAISEADVALLLQAKAAIGAGIETLLDCAGISAEEVGRVILAGGFGMHLNVAHAIGIGLLPGFREESVETAGNTSLAGALIALLDRTTLMEMDDLRRKVEVVELNLEPDFEDRFVDHLSLP
jgi:uncharacterized 2Fe-2S/4Fe-4S cluster protein (DUF4445 family)